MKYFSLQTVVNAYDLVSTTTKEKFWGILGILYSIDNLVKPYVNYSIDSCRLSTFLETRFRLNHKKTYNIPSPYSVVFALNWEEKTLEYFLVGKPNIMPIIIWAFRNVGFQNELTAKELFEKFLNEFHLSKESVDKLFTINFDLELDYIDLLYDDNNLLTTLGGKPTSDVSTLKMNKSFVVANAGDLSRGPFFQPLYASLNTLECLIIFPFDSNGYMEYYNASENNKNTCFVNESQQRQQIYYGAPGTGKSHIINKTTCGESVIRTTFHPDSDYSTFVGCYKPTTKTVKMRDMAGHVIRENGEDVTEDRIVYEFVEQAFLQAYVKAWKFYDKDNEEVEKQFLVIEEINRGNCAQIFGDLFQLLDRNAYGFSDYPIQADNDMKKQLAKAFRFLEISQERKDRINACYKGGRDIVQQVLSGDILLLPDNFYIWATMNTSDQSLFPIDSAFKRRWDWQYMPIAKGREDGKELNWRIEAGENHYDWWSFLTKINEQIGSTTNSEDKKLGFFFCKAKNGIISAETFVGKVIFYLWNDVFKDFGFEGTIFNDEDGSTLSFDKFYSADADGKVIVNKDKVQRFLDNLGVEVASVVELNEEDEEADEDEESSVSTNNDFVKYSFNKGTKLLGKSELGFTIMDKFIEENPNLTFDELKKEFPDSMTTGVPNRGLIVEETLDLGSYSRYYSPKNYKSADGILFKIFKQWTIRNVDNIIAFAQKQNWTVEEQGKWERKDN